MAAPKFHLVVMAGGSGTRFWPQSTSKRPKQLLGFGSDQSLLEQTVNRFGKVLKPETTWIVTTETLGPAIEKLLPNKVKILREPQGRNTAPCIYWAAQEIHAVDKDALMVVLPADHSIGKPEQFLKTLENALEVAQKKEVLVTLGILPTRPETGYGYLEISKEEISDGCFRVARFVEKPNLETAKTYVDSGRYLWNGGMFVWKTGTILEEFDRHVPEMKKNWMDAGANVLKAYPKLPATSVDYAIMEKSNRVVTFKLDCEWDDLGSWISLEALGERLDKIESSGVVMNAKKVIALKSKGNIIDVKDRYVALLGAENLVVVETDDVLMIADKALCQEIKDLVSEAKKIEPRLV